MSSVAEFTDDEIKEQLQYLGFKNVPRDKFNQFKTGFYFKKWAKLYLLHLCFFLLEEFILSPLLKRGNRFSLEGISEKNFFILKEYCHP